MSCLREVWRGWRRAGGTAKQQEQPEVKTKTKAKERIVIEKRVCFDYVTNKAEDERKREREIKLKKELEKTTTTTTKTTTTTLAFNLKSCSHRQHKTFNEQERARREADPVTDRVWCGERERERELKRRSNKQANTHVRRQLVQPKQTSFALPHIHKH